MSIPIPAARKLLGKWVSKGITVAELRRLLKGLLITERAAAALLRTIESGHDFTFEDRAAFYNHFPSLSEVVGAAQWQNVPADMVALLSYLTFRAQVYVAAPPVRSLLC